VLRGRSARLGRFLDDLDGFGRRRLFPRRYWLGGPLRLRGQKSKVTAQPIGQVVLERAGVGLLVGDAELGQHLQKPGRLHFQLPSQLVDADLTHKTC
jgi:hypothetical protein